MLHDMSTVCDLPKEDGGRVCKYMHTRAIHNAVTHGRTVQKGGSHPPNPRLITPCMFKPFTFFIVVSVRNDPRQKP